MKKLLALAAATLSSVAAFAQAPSCNAPAPAGSLSTLWAGGVYLGTTSATVGFNAMFDLVTNNDLTISQIDMNFYDNGTPATNPILVGQTTTMDFYTCPTAWAGNQNNQPAWTLRGTATVTVAAPGAPGSPCVFTTPFVLPAGSYGVALNVLPVTTGTVTGPLHPLYTNPASSPGTATVYRDQYMQLTAGGFQGTAWAGTPALRVINTRIHYQPSANAGYATPFGAGCYNRPQTFYEYLVGPGGGNFTAYDLSNTTLSMINQGSSYLVLPGASSIIPPLSTPLATTNATYDDAITAPQILPFTFNFPGGSTTQVIVSTNGHIFLGASTATFGPYNMSQFFTDVPRLAAAWSDLDLTTSGTMHFDVDPSTPPQFATVTWMNCPEWDPATGPGLGGNTFQIVLHANGNVDYVYGQVRVYNSPLVIGYARGQGTFDPGSRDLSATIPFVAGDGQVPPVLGTDVRPVAGTTMNFVCSNIEGSTAFGVLLMSFGSTSGIDLSAYGMPGCSQYVTLPAVTLFAPVTAGSMSVPLAIPPGPGFNGVNLFAQTAPLTPGLNQANIVTSNGLCVRMGIE